MKKILLPMSLFMLVIATTVSSCIDNGERHTKKSLEIDSLKNQILLLTASNDMVAKNITTFDVLDFAVFSNLQWTRWHESYSNDVKVHWPDGHIATGLSWNTTLETGGIKVGEEVSILCEIELINTTNKTGIIELS